MLFLVICPERDYEILSDGDTESCMRAMSDRVVEADSADAAIQARFADELPDLDMLRSVFCFPVGSRHGLRLSPAAARDMQMRAQTRRADEERRHDEAELQRLQEKLNKR